MEWESFTTDQLEQLLAADEGRVSQLRARQLLVLEELDRRQVATADGCKSLSEWLAARLDLSLDTASSLVQTMRRTGSRDDLLESLADDEISFDRNGGAIPDYRGCGFLVLVPSPRDHPPAGFPIYRHPDHGRIRFRHPDHPARPPPIQA